MLLLTQCYQVEYSRDENGRTAQITSKEPSLPLVVFGVAAIGAALGININPEAIGKALESGGKILGSGKGEE
jgi:hypothetical protein